MKARYALLLLAAVLLIGAATSRTPLLRAFLQSNLDGGGFAVTNLSSITVTGGFTGLNTGLTNGSGQTITEEIAAAGGGDVTTAQLTSATNLIYSAGTNAAKSYTDQTIGTYQLGSTILTNLSGLGDTNELARTSQLSDYVPVTQYNTDTNTLYQAATNTANDRVIGATNATVLASVTSQFVTTPALTNSLATWTNQGATVLAFPPTGTRWYGFATNNNWEISGFTGVDPYETNVQTIVMVITNNVDPNATKTITLPASVIIPDGSTQYITNQAVLTITRYPGMGTNAAFKCLK